MKNENFESEMFQSIDCENVETSSALALEMQASADLFMEWLESVIEPLGDPVRLLEQNASDEVSCGPDLISGEHRPQDVRSSVQPLLEQVPDQQYETEGSVDADMDQNLSLNAGVIPPSVPRPMAVTHEQSQDRVFDQQVDPEQLFESTPIPNPSPSTPSLFLFGSGLLLSEQQIAEGQQRELAVKNVDAGEETICIALEEHVPTSPEPPVTRGFYHVTETQRVAPESNVRDFTKRPTPSVTADVGLAQPRGVSGHVSPPPDAVPRVVRELPVPASPESPVPREFYRLTDTLGVAHERSVRDLTERPTPGDTAGVGVAQARGVSGPASPPTDAVPPFARELRVPASPEPPTPDRFNRGADTPRVTQERHVPIFKERPTPSWTADVETTSPDGVRPENALGYASHSADTVPCAARERHAATSFARTTPSEHRSLLKVVDAPVVFSLEASTVVKGLVSLSRTKFASQSVADAAPGSRVTAAVFPSAIRYNTAGPSAKEITISRGFFISTKVQAQSRQLPGAEIALGLLLAVSAVARQRGQIEALPLNLTIARAVQPLAPASVVVAQLTYTITSGESLKSVAVSLFGDSDIGWLLADLNRGQTRQEAFDDTLVVEIRAGTRLLLPSDGAASSFKFDPDSRQLKNLVTIITENAFHSELVQALSGAMGCESTGHPGCIRLHEEFV